MTAWAMEVEVMLVLRSVLITTLFVFMVVIALLELRKVVARRWRDVREEGK